MKRVEIRHEQEKKNVEIEAMPAIGSHIRCEQPMKESPHGAMERGCKVRMRVDGNTTPSFSLLLIPPSPAPILLVNPEGHPTLYKGSKILLKEHLSKAGTPTSGKAEYCEEYSVLHI